MNQKFLKPIVVSITTFMLAGCVNGGMPTVTNADGSTNNTQTGAIIGGLLGAVVGGTTANRGGKRVLIGGALGSAVGAAIGYSLDQQAAEVAQVLNTNVNNNPSAEQNVDNDLIVSNTDKYVKIMFRDDMMFATNSATPTPSAQAKIAKLTPVLKKYPNTIIQTVGHTDNRGNFQYNQKLSEARASSVGNTIHARGIQNPLYSKGCSFSKPIAQNTSPTNMALNRRVEVYLYPNQESVIDPCRQ